MNRVCRCAWLRPSMRAVPSIKCALPLGRRCTTQCSVTIVQFQTGGHRHVYRPLVEPRNRASEARRSNVDPSKLIDAGAWGRTAPAEPASQCTRAAQRAEGHAAAPSAQATTHSVPVPAAPLALLIAVANSLVNWPVLGTRRLVLGARRGLAMAQSATQQTIASNETAAARPRRSQGRAAPKGSLGRARGGRPRGATVRNRAGARAAAGPASAAPAGMGASLHLAAGCPPHHQPSFFLSSFRGRRLYSRRSSGPISRTLGCVGRNVPARVRVGARRGAAATRVSGESVGWDGREGSARRGAWPPSKARSLYCASAPGRRAAPRADRRPPLVPGTPRRTLSRRAPGFGQRRHRPGPEARGGAPPSPQQPEPPGPRRPHPPGGRPR
jgi:hypothetical protein